MFCVHLQAAQRWNIPSDLSGSPHGMYRILPRSGRYYSNVSLWGTTMACSEQKYSLYCDYTTCEHTQNVPVLPSLTQDVNVRGDGGVWLLLHRLALSPLPLLCFSTVSLRSIINEEVCSWSIPHTNKILPFCREIWRLKQSAGSLSTYLLLHAGRESIFSAGCPGHRRPVETPRSCCLQSKNSHIPSVSVQAPLSLMTKKGKDNLTGREIWQDIPNIFNTVCGENVLFQLKTAHHKNLLLVPWMWQRAITVNVNLRGKCNRLFFT